ncbi:hypothetical protein M378DRAFT_9028 [Amanita muscaria Koide BX008]|uniref:Uncharacterized protein n=1 Tax=Amanita muscaria (strain Koide BX008) TaxID=946122 RepID=A0A0C2TKY9_AMAMK|nr:hypothetical protein M378DRAFT_9028 [Amanita muscaria Koide BX008]
MRFDCRGCLGIKSGRLVVTLRALPMKKPDVEKKEKHEQRECFTSIVFDEKAVNTEALKSYLTTIFSGKHASKVLEEVHEKMEEFCDDLFEKKISVFEVRMTINAAMGHLNDENIAALRESSVPMTAPCQH